MTVYFSKLYKSFGANVKGELDLSNYAIKVDLKGATVADSSNLVEKSDLASSKAEVEKIDIDKLITAPDDLSKVIIVVDKVKNCVYE